MNTKKQQNYQMQVEIDGAESAKRRRDNARNAQAVMKEKEQQPTHKRVIVTIEPREETRQPNEVRNYPYYDGCYGPEPVGDESLYFPERRGAKYKGLMDYTTPDVSQYQWRVPVDVYPLKVAYTRETPKNNEPKNEQDDWEREFEDGARPEYLNVD
ncbi:hypothetical protein JTB14_038208 [Gonioctena quinquepunctata]|nr:hypothetical protein JTB14_038208 [Gonioctena quinquepunctata]